MHEEKTLLRAEQYLREEINKDHKDEISSLINKKNEEGILDLKDEVPPIFYCKGINGLVKMKFLYNHSPHTLFHTKQKLIYENTKNEFLSNTTILHYNNSCEQELS